MALKKVKLNSTGGRGQRRFFSRTEVKDGSRKRRRRADSRAAKELS